MRVAGSGLQVLIPVTIACNPDPGGDPLEMEVTGEADTPDAGQIITATVTNDVVSY